MLIKEARVPQCAQDNAAHVLCGYVLVQQHSNRVPTGPTHWLRKHGRPAGFHMVRVIAARRMGTKLLGIMDNAAHPLHHTQGRQRSKGLILPRCPTEPHRGPSGTLPPDFPMSRAPFLFTFLTPAL